MQDDEFDFDATDERIIAALNENCRLSYRALSRKVRVAPATLIERMRRLEKSGVILGYSAVIDQTAFGYAFAAAIEVTIKHGALLEVQKRIALLPGVFAVYDVTGGSDSIVMVRTRSRGEFSRLVKKILAIENVERTNTHIILNIIKESNRLMNFA